MSKDKIRSLEHAVGYLVDGAKQLDKMCNYLDYNLSSDPKKLKESQEVMQKALVYIGENIDLALEEIARAENSMYTTEILIERFVDETESEK